jgi:CRISPR-associated protein Cmr2
MDELKFWQQKIVQAFHDPPGKPYAFFPGAGGHAALAKRLFKTFTANELKFSAKRPDFAAAGADRPVAYGGRGKPELDPGMVRFNGNRGNSVVTHPLAGGQRKGDAGAPVLSHVLRLPEPQTVEEGKSPALEDILELLNHQDETLQRVGFAGWTDASALHRGFVAVWRRFRDDLALAHPAERLLWERVPGDTRSPDHSIWEHTKVTSALAFLDSGKKVPTEKEPWLFTFSLTPVQAFIEQSRKSRDLWVSSFLLAELAWHAMLPIVEHYGPDAIVYPDLRGNPRVDNWLKYEWAEVRDASGERVEPLPKDAYPHTHAAMLPETFVAILPRGGAGHLKRLEDVSRECAERMTERWNELAKDVRGLLLKKTKDASWTAIWDRQHRTPPITSFWSAVHWQVPQAADSSEQLQRLTEGGALLAQDRSNLPAPSAKTLEAAAARERRLAAWTSPEVWAHYEKARSVFGQVNLKYLRAERGFDYALTHHELRMRQRLRKQEARYHDVREDELGEKCTLCRERQALYDDRTSKDESIDGLRERVREFWSNKELDDEQTGAERLCGICAFKRFLVEAGGTGGVNSIWGEPEELAKQLNASEENGKVRFPFPSTSAVAAQEFLEALVQSTSPEVRDAVGEVVAAHRATGLTRTLFAETLPRLDAASRLGPGAEAFLKIEPQESCLPDALEAQIERAKKDGDRGKAERLSKLGEAARRLRKAASDAKVEPPDSHFAVVMLDGDNLGKLLVGDAKTIRTRWRDVIHPRIVKALESDQKPKLRELWASLLDAERLMGPSLHAFISRALADFSHRIVPWVVEQEYGGRLVYSGGDDVLALAPACDALPLAARVQQLYSAAWIVDTMPEITAWSWRSGKSTWTFNPKKARTRFAIPKPLEDTQVQDAKPLEAIELPLHAENVLVPVGLDRSDLGLDEIDGQVLAGLGPFQSLSASVVYGHFKTQLSTMLRRGRWLLDHVAKSEAGRSAVALAHHSRGGLKTEIALNWDLPGGTRWSGEDTAHELVQRVSEAFRKGDLPQRLPYKLREVSPLLLAADDEKREQLAKGLLSQALDQRPEEDSEKELLEKAALRLWLEGHRHRVRKRQLEGSGTPNEGQAPRLDEADAERFVDGLLLCRYLAGYGGEDE